MGEIGGPDRKTKQKEITITETRKKWNEEKTIKQSGYPWNQSEVVPDVYGG